MTKRTRNVIRLKSAKSYANEKRLGHALRGYRLVGPPPMHATHTRHISSLLDEGHDHRISCIPQLSVEVPLTSNRVFGLCQLFGAAFLERINKFPVPEAVWSGTSSCCVIACPRSACVLHKIEVLKPLKLLKQFLRVKFATRRYEL